MNIGASIERNKNYTVKVRSNIRYTPVWITVVLSVLSLGIYLPYWLLTRRKEVNRLAGQNVIHRGIPLTILIFFCFSALIYTIAPIFINEVALMLYDYIDILITYLGIIVILYYSFKIRTIVKANSNQKINDFLVLIFHIWYLQYLINKQY